MQFLLFILFFLVVIYAVIVIYAAYCKFRGVSLSYVEGEIREEKGQAIVSFFGFTLSDIILNGANFILAIAVLLSILTTWDTAKINQNSNTDFELRIRPYLIIDNVEGNTDLITKESRYRVFIKNTGTMPAKIISQTMDCLEASASSAVLKNDIVGATQSIVYPFEIKNGDKILCVLDIKYRSALEGFSVKEYQTQQTFLHEFGKQISSGGGLMK